MQLSLLLDLYELTMLAGYLREEMVDEPAAFDLYFRENPFRGGYAIFAGLEPCLEYLESLRFGERESAYLGSLGLFDDRFLSYLRSFRFAGRVTAVAEGEVVFAGEPLLTVEAPLAQAQVVETALLNMIGFQTLIATKASRLACAAGPGTLVEFGARRAHGPDGALGATRAAFVGGAGATSHLRAGSAFGIPVSGTVAHSWVMAFPSEIEAFRAYAAAFPDACVLLVDTYDTLGSGVPNAIKVAGELRAVDHGLRGIRLDSGDLAHLSKEARRMLDDAGFPDVRIVASNELDESIIDTIRREGGRIDVYGVGTSLVTGAGDGGGALGVVYKLVELDGRPRIKISADRAKSTIPGRKSLYRVSRGERFAMDVLGEAGGRVGVGDEAIDPSSPKRRYRVPAGSRTEEIRSIVMEGGRRTRAAPSLEAIADTAKQRLSRLPAGCTRLQDPESYTVALTLGLDRKRRDSIERAILAHPGPQVEEGPHDD